MANPWIKICGTTSIEDAELCRQAGADAIGFVFTHSPRQIEPESAAQIISSLSGPIEKIGVFVDEPLESLLATAETAGLTGVQLHGDESPYYVAQLRQSEPQLKVIKAISAETARYKGLDHFVGGEELVDAMMVDSGNSRIRGGTGREFDWLGVSNFIMELQNRCPVIIAGGLNAGNVSAAMILLQPNGFDVVSGTESSPGKKDKDKVRKFVEAVRGSRLNSPK